MGLRQGPTAGWLPCPEGTALHAMYTPALGTGRHTPVHSTPRRPTTRKSLSNALIHSSIRLEGAGGPGGTGMGAYPREATVPPLPQSSIRLPWSPPRTTDMTEDSLGAGSQALGILRELWKAFQTKRFLAWLEG